MNIDGISVVVTGSGRGIGRGIARELARQGAWVACASRSKDEVQETVRLIQGEGGAALPVPTDVTDRQQVERMVERILTTFGQIDVLINNAGVLRAIGGLWEVDADTWWSDVRTNLWGPFLCIRVVLAYMTWCRRTEASSSTWPEAALTARTPEPRTTRVRRRP